jgi:cytochrome oxidase Cu insertion factor (SCO1/SenC/PrrC family)
VRFAELVARRVVAINFVFTTCTTSCPLLGTNFAQLQGRLGKRLGKRYGLVSISVDPVHDTPERLKAWAERYRAGPDWSLVTGRKAEVNRLLKALNAYTPDKKDHPSLIVVLDGATGLARRASGLAPVGELVSLMETMPPPAAPAAALGPLTAGHRYFTDAELVNQDGRRVRFYTDLLSGKVVVINTFFTACTGSCLVMHNTLARLQERLGDRLGRDINLLSLSVDPEVDTPAMLHTYAQRFRARPGWHFLTGDKSVVAGVLKKLGQFVENRDAHSSILLIGNEPTGLWKKAFGLGKPEAIFAVVDSVLADGAR